MAICDYGCGREGVVQFKNGKWCCSKNIASCPSIKKKNEIINKEAIASPIKTIEKCDYGCKKIAKFRLKNGKLCCSNNYRKCPGKSKATKINTNKLCDYGCGNIANFKFKNGKYCCNEFTGECPEIKRRYKESTENSTPIQTTELCDYGCGQIAKYKHNNSKLCCSNNISGCPVIIEKKRITRELPSTPIQTTELCYYGCGKIAKFKLTNEKLCCSESHNDCESVRNHISESLKGLTPWNKDVPCSEETKNKIRKSLTGYIHTEETRTKQSKARKGVKKTPEHKRNIGIAHTGKKRKPFSKEWRENLSKAGKDKEVSIETRKKISKSKTGVPRSKETRRKLRISTIKRIENQVGQISPNYNPNACEIIDEYGKEHDYNFQHAMNGGEFRISDLGYWVDGYDKDKNTVIEINEPSHYTPDNKLNERDKIREQEIIEYLDCKFIRIRIDKNNNILDIKIINEFGTGQLAQVLCA